MDLDGKTVADLKEMLREQDLPVSGTKAQLVERLQANSATDAKTTNAGATPTAKMR